MKKKDNNERLVLENYESDFFYEKDFVDFETVTFMA